MNMTEALSKLNSALQDCQEAGINIGVSKMFGGIKSTWGIFISSDEVDCDGSCFTQHVADKEIATA